MPEIAFNDFSAGWIPGDDPVKGRQNGLLAMDNLELDKNGALQVCGGTVVKNTYSSPAHTLFSRLINGSRADYAALADGTVYRNSTSIGSSGNSANAAFGTAFNFTLIASGDTRLKDSGSGSPVSLGVGAATAVPTVSTNWDTAPSALFATLSSAYTVVPSGYGSVTFPSSPFNYMQMTANSNGQAIVQTYHSGLSLVNLNSLTDLNSQAGNAMDSDVVVISGYTPNPFGGQLKLDILLSAGNSSGDAVSDYYTYQVTDLASQSDFDPITGAFTLYIRRDLFSRVGTSTANWTTTYGFRITFIGTAGQVINLYGPGNASVKLGIYGGTNALNGVYQFAQVNVNNTGSYLAISPLGPVTNSITVNNSLVQLTLQAPADAQVNEVWVYARSTGDSNILGDSSGLNLWYRIAKITSNFTTAFYSTIGDLAALTLGIYYDTSLTTIASSGISDKIYDIIGPINGRWYYFTTNFMYPSDINNPDLVKTGLGVRISGSSSELFLWARQVNPNTVLVGTSVDVYTLTGTFQTFPDGSVDIYYLPLHCKYPPITCDAEVYGGSVYYLANDGWRLIDSGGSNPSLVSPILDRLYRGETCGPYSPPSIKVIPRSIRMPIVIAKNKMFCFITGLGTPRIEVYDFIRQYWRPVLYGLGDFSAACSTQDGQVLAFFSGDNKTREVDVQSSRLIDASTASTIKLLTVFNNELPYNRKDSATLKIRNSTATSSLTAYLRVNSDSSTDVSIGSIASSSGGNQESFYDLFSVTAVKVVKNYAVLISGSCNNATIEDIVIVYDPRPLQRTYVKGLNENFGTAAGKRVRVWPLVIDTLGQDVTFTPYVNDVAKTALTINTSNKDTTRYYFKTDVDGVDYGYTITGANLFEFYGMMTPEIVQVYPIRKQFDQVGPEEFFRFGKIKQLEFRFKPYGGTSIPFVIYFNDASTFTGTLTVVDAVDASYFIMLPKGVSGNIMRIEFGPTSFDFTRYYVRAQVAKSGDTTELDWVTLG